MSLSKLYEERNEQGEYVEACEYDDSQGDDLECIKDVRDYLGLVFGFHFHFEMRCLTLCFRERQVIS